MNTYIVKEGQTLLDISLQVYGSVDYLVKLLVDNNADINATLVGGTTLLYDASLFALSPISNQLQLANYSISTAGELLVNTQPALNTMLEHSDLEHTTQEHN